MNRRILSQPLLLLLLLSGCGGEAISQVTPSPSPATVIEPGIPQRRFKLQLTLTSPEDLKVQVGDTVIPGQILADRVRDRVRLEFQQAELQRRIEWLQKMLSEPVPEVAGLPLPSFLQEAAEVERLQLKVAAAQQAKDIQQRKLDLLTTTQGLPDAVIPHEQAQLERRVQELDQATAEVILARGKLAKAQTDRQYQEYVHSLEMSKRTLSLRDQELRQQGQLADLETNLSQIQTQLSQLSVVRSPYAGKIQRIKFNEQRDQALAVELVMLVDQRSRPGASQTSPTTPPSPASSAETKHSSRCAGHHSRPSDRQKTRPSGRPSDRHLPR